MTPEQWLAAFRETDEPQPEYDYVECETCTLGSVVEKGTKGGEWLAKHECPESWPKDEAQTAYELLVRPNVSPVHPRTKAKLVMAWRAGWIRP